MIDSSLALVRRHAVDSFQDLQGVGSYHFLFDATGYGYCLAWGISFYPQLILNWRRKSTEGMSIGFLWYNLLGFMLYLVYTSFVPDATVQDQIFAAHALVITLLTLIQVPYYGVNKLGDFPRLHGKTLGGLLLVLDLFLLLNIAKVMSLMTLLYACGYLKTLISLIKYTPQLYMNWERKSTIGFAMGMVFLDLAGGTLSLLQQFVQCGYDDSTSSVRPAWTWEPFSGNKPKLLLGLIAIFYDLCFFYQHFVMYAPGVASIMGQPLSAAEPNSVEGRPSTKTTTKTPEEKATAAS